ncbi:SPFH domain-containing protein [Nonomuraea sp. NPDC050547]|uniref:SPFH domain-containing protein n=1 Tax=Nonomuraea sp. NPDC050547 TaxID=3364368 RepID=UPI0037B927BC
MRGTDTSWIVAAAALVLLLAAALRSVPRGHHLVVLRYGRAVAVRRRGLVVVIPFLDRTRPVPAGAELVEAFALPARTRDGLRVRVSVVAHVGVTDRTAYALAARPPLACAAEELERQIVARVAAATLNELARSPENVGRLLHDGLQARVARLGLGVVRVEPVRLELRADPALLRWARERHTVPTDEGAPMEIHHTTVPGTGDLHHLRTRAGERLSVLVDHTQRRHLHVYGTGEADQPLVAVTLDGDEADQLAELLNSRKTADRLAALERRLERMEVRAS